MQRTITEMTKIKRIQGAKVKIGYRKLKINDKILGWRDNKLEETTFQNRQNSMGFE